MNEILKWCPQLLRWSQCLKSLLDFLQLLNIPSGAHGLFRPRVVSFSWIQLDWPLPWLKANSNTLLRDVHVIFFPPFFSYSLTEAGWTFLGCFGKADLLSCRWGVGPGSVCFRCVHWWWDSMQHFMSFAQMPFWAPSGQASLVWGACSGMVAPRTQNNLVTSGWHGAKLGIGKGFTSLGQVLPTEIHCSWKGS